MYVKPLQRNKPTAPSRRQPRPADDCRRSSPGGAADGPSVPVVVGLVRSLCAHADVLGLLLGQVGQPDDQLLEVQPGDLLRSEEHTSELPSIMRISYAVFCLKK